MKQFLLFALLLGVVSANATVRTVNNNTPTPGQYNTITAAITASSVGDTLYVSGSALSYGNMTITKQLVIIGTGHRPQKQDSVPCKFDNILVNPAGASSQIHGVTCDYIYMNNTGANDVLVRRCKILGYLYSVYTVCGQNNSGWRMEECVFTGAVSVLQHNSTCTYWTNMQFKNCSFNGQIFLRGDNNTNNSFDHCQFIGGPFNLHYNSFIEGCIFSNCIFYRTNPAALGSVCNFNRCLSYQCANNSFTANGSVATNCLTNVDPQFVNFPGTGAPFSYLHDYNITAGPANNYGNDGTDLGVNGSLLQVWDINGVPHIPQVSELNVLTPSVSQGGNLQLNVKSYIPK